MFGPHGASATRNGCTTALRPSGSSAGIIFGYLLGSSRGESIGPPLGFYSGDGAPAFAEAQRLFQEWGVWFVFMAVSPHSYRVTISAGFMALALVPFIIASAAGRAARFFLVAGLVRWVGARYEPMLRRHIEFSGWLAVAILVLIFVFREWL